MSKSASPSAKRKVLCVVMDGIGHSPSKFGNAVLAAQTPNLNFLAQNFSFTTLKAHGTYVGLPSNSDIGNSEVGHNALGAGKIYDQGAKLADRAIDSGAMFAGKVWQDMVKQVKETKGTMHFMGLLSDGNVHSHERHLFAMLAQAKKDGVPRVRIHVLFDGRDVAEKSAEVYVDKLQKVMTSLRDKTFDVAAASGGGRMMVTMDRYEADWSIVERGWQAHVHGQAPHYFGSLEEAVMAFRQDKTLVDQNFPPFVLTDSQKNPLGKIKDNDAVVFFNFRGDRAIEISRAFTEEVLVNFDRGQVPKVYFAGMMQYDGDLQIPKNYLVTPPAFSETLTEELLKYKVRQFACSETQKFGHVTYFWNGNNSGYVDKKYEIYLEIPSDRISFDEKPEMKAKEICDATIKAIENDQFDFGRINFANGDMVGHTGNYVAAIKAVEMVDFQIGRLMEVCRKHNVILVVTADHGNADEMFDAKEAKFPNWEWDWHDIPPKTAHTLNPVPFYVFDPLQKKPYNLRVTDDAGLANVANTILSLAGLPESGHYLPSLILKS